MLVPCLVVALSAGAQEVDELMQGFEPNGEFQVEIDGTLAESTEIFLAERPQAYLLVSKDLGGSFLLELRRGTVSRVHSMKLLRRDDGTIDLVADASPRTLGRYELSGRSVTFAVDGKSVRVGEKPPLVGLHDSAAMTAHNPGYGRGAAAYEPDASAMDALRSVDGDVRVRVYFGSWCPHCTRHVPFIMRVENELREAGAIAFEYFGLPKPTGNDDPWPEKVKNVPTAIVYRDGQEVGRVSDNEWRAPEIELSKLVGETSAAGR